MALDQAANFVRETVTSAISSGDTTINVADASPFPVPPEGYNIVVWDGAAYVRPDQDPDVEIMRVTDTDTTNDTLTVARGQEGTSDVSHPDTSVVVVAQTAKMIADIASEKISNPVTETVNVDGNDVTNVAALDADRANVGNISAQSNGVNTRYSADLVAVSGSGTEVIFDLTSAVDVLWGVINGTRLGRVTYEFDGGTSVDVYANRKDGNDNNGGIWGSATLPPAQDVTKIEFVNDGVNEFEFGYEVATQ